MQYVSAIRKSYLVVQPVTVPRPTLLMASQQIVLHGRVFQFEMAIMVCAKQLNNNFKRAMVLSLSRGCFANDCFLDPCIMRRTMIVEIIVPRGRRKVVSGRSQLVSH